MAVPISTLRELIKNERWADIASLLTGESKTDEVSAEVALAGYKANTKVGNPDAAEYWLDRALTLVPANSTLQRDKGVFHQKRQEWLEATAYFEKASILRPEIASYHGSLGYARYQLGNHHGAAESFRAALAIDSANRGWWIRLARSLIHVNNLHDAVDAYAKALELQEDAPTRSARDELLRQIRSGSRAASSAYYDAVFSDSLKYQQSGVSSEYAPIWQEIVEYLRDNKTTSILDLGCGPGQFAEFIATHMPAVQYTGLDFSSVAISRARQRCTNFLFEKRELPTSNFDGLPSFDTVVCTEVLEHVENDREILAVLPVGTTIVATVPNFDSFGHVRLFRNEDEVRERYGRLFDNLLVRGIAISAQNTLWLMHGRRSAQTIDDQTSIARAAQDHLGLLDLGVHTVESILWTDGTRYVEDFLPIFGLPFVPVCESVGLQEPHVALRHDVDHSIENAFAMANVEHQLGIRSTYFLLHPDGDLTCENYFGRIEKDQLIIAPSMFDWAARLLDLGHEVGLHNDLLSLALATRRQPGEFIEQIIEAFSRHGIPIAGSVAHGSRTCRQLGYMNYQIFQELQQMHVAADYRDTPELFDRFSEPSVQKDGHTVNKFALRMADYGLKYEANFVPWEVYVSDSSARWSVWHGPEVTRFEKFEPREHMSELLAVLLRNKKPRTAVQCLIHADHWNAVVNARQNQLRRISKRRNNVFATKRRAAMLQRLDTFENVLLARSSERFDTYDQEYGTKSQFYNVATSVGRFVDELLRAHAAHSSNLMEVGCGQGDFIASVHSQLQAANPNRKISALGIDGSPAAIVTCAGRYPQMEWVADELEHFLGVHDEIVFDDDGAARRYDLILDKTGAIFIQDYDEARRYFTRINSLLNPGGLYVYIASRHYYEEVLCKKNYATWPQDWLALASDTFEPLLADDDVAPALRGYIKRVFRKQNESKFDEHNQ
ncbi:MAG: methyltransferase domain-containing protein [Sterolibacterium sp.]|nr:methyltransferase domain-containing protein [Sterolibacterium sp.]